MRRYYLFVILSIFTALMIVFSITPPIPVSRYKMLNVKNIAIDNCPIVSKELSRCDAYQQTTSYTCGPAVVMTVMYYYKKINAAKLNKTYELEIANSMGAIPGSSGGTTQSELIEWLVKHGFKVEAGENIKTDRLIHNIDLGIPTIVGFNGHWLVAKGYNKVGNTKSLKTDEIIFADSCCGVSKLTRYEIDADWQKTRAPFRYCNKQNGVYIIPTPTQQ